MLTDKKRFDIVEQALLKNGIIERFEKENGKITGRMMITLTDIPVFIDCPEKGEYIYAFECSFDFYDVTLGFVLNTKNFEVLSPMWATEQIPDADPPDRVWSEFFVTTLVDHISDNGSFSIPIYTFVNDNSDFTVTPTI